MKDYGDEEQSDTEDNGIGKHASYKYFIPILEAKPGVCIVNPAKQTYQLLM